ncbi:MAG TPA: flagellar basal-body MS-ring/collar protein FliF [Terriglobia bacterium]|nr:flagellar basal-body MS-ring/collar protein FliF [Terriglobia bacterium]
MNPLMQTLRNLGPMKLAALGAVALGLIAFFVFLAARLTSPGMSLLYSGLDAADSEQIVQRLETQQIPYELRGSGDQIYVPEDQVARLRLAMAGEGIPTGGSVGYEIFDRADALGTTNFVQQINQLRALEGELSRTIRSLRQVKAARVHLVLPKRELFSRDRNDPTASVVLVLQGSLDKEQVQSIQHLVASAVPGMKSTNVSVIDNRGNLLAKGQEAGEEFDSSNSEEMRQGYEARMAQSIEELLAQTLGAGKVRAEVTADIDFSRVTTNTENFDPNGQVVRSTQTVEDKGNTQEKSGDSSVSVANNVPNPPSQNSGNNNSSNSQNERNEETVNYEISKRSETQVKTNGTVKRVSAAVLVDGAYTPGTNGTQAYAPRSQEELDKIATLVKSAIGYDEKRGDVVQVVNMPFAQNQEAISDGTIFMGLDKQDLMRIVELVVLAAVAVLVLLLVVRPLLNRLLAMPGAASAEQGLLPGLSAEAAAALPPGAAAALALSGPSESMQQGLMAAENIANEIDQMIDINQVEGRVRASSLKKISELVEQHPEQAVNIMRQWMYQEA